MRWWIQTFIRLFRHYRIREDDEDPSLPYVVARVFSGCCVCGYTAPPRLHSLYGLPHLSPGVISVTYVYQRQEI